MKKVALLIDSSYGVKKEMLKQYEDTYLLPLLLNFPDETEIEDDDDVISYDEFYDILEHQVIKTSQIPLGKMMTTWNDLLKTYEKIVFVGLSKGLSGQHDSTYMLSQQDEYKDRVFVIDTDGVSLIIRKMIDDIYQWIKSGINVAEIQTKIDELKQHFSAFIVPKSLETLKRGGRITPAAAALAKVLKITPILRYDGKIDKFDKTRTFKKAVETALTQIKKERESRKIDLVYSKMNDELLEEVKNIIKEKGFEINQLANLPNVIAAHTGANTIALICWDK